MRLIIGKVCQNGWKTAQIFLKFIQKSVLFGLENANKPVFDTLKKMRNTLKNIMYQFLNYVSNTHYN